MKTNYSAYKTISAALANVDVAIPGTLRTVFMKCGKESCPCSSGDKKYRHGPYYFWDRKVNGKPSSMSIPEKLVPTFKKWIANRKTIEATLEKILAVGQKIAANSKNTGN